MALRERLLAERAWSPLVRIEQLICELEGVRGGPSEAALSAAAEVPPAPVLSVEMLRERAPMLVQACARLVAVTADQFSSNKRGRLCPARSRC